MFRRGGIPRDSFQFPSFPPAMEAALKKYDVPTIAQDDVITGTFDWGNRNAIVSAYAEGIVFLGYPYLAILSQRPEYRVVSEIIGTEMTREWITLKAASGEESKAEKIKLINDRLDELGVRHAFQKCAVDDGRFGRSHLYLDTGKTDDPAELKMDLGTGRSILSKAKVGSQKSGKPERLRRITVVEAQWGYPTRYNSTDPLNPDWYNPSTWFVMSREIHRSRFLTFIGREVPDILKPAYAFGGLSMTQMLKPYVDNWLRTRQSVSDLIQNFSVNVLKTNMDATTSLGGENLLERVAIFNNIKNNQGTLVLDKENEDFANTSAPLGGLDSLQAQSQEHMAAIARIPLVKFLGIQPAGLNASSEGELISFEDWIAAFQEVLFRPNLTKVIDFVQLSLFDEVDDDIVFDFNPLRQMKPLEQAQHEQTVAQTRETYFSMGAVDAQEVRESLAQDPETPFSGVDLKKELPVPGMGGIDPLTGEPLPGGAPGPGEASLGGPGAPPPGLPNGQAQNDDLQFQYDMGFDHLKKD
jgi:phage-related protein (TIGR01555 family)